MIHWEIPNGIELTILGLIVFIYGFIFMYSLVDCLKANFWGNEKFLWVFLILFLPVIGSLLYLYIGRMKKLKKPVE